MPRPSINHKRNHSFSSPEYITVGTWHHPRGIYNPVRVSLHPSETVGHSLLVHLSIDRLCIVDPLPAQFAHHIGPENTKHAAQRPYSTRDVFFQGFKKKKICLSRSGLLQAARVQNFRVPDTHNFSLFSVSLW